MRLSVLSFLAYQGREDQILLLFSFPSLHKLGSSEEAYHFIFLFGSGNGIQDLTDAELRSTTHLYTKFLIFFFF